MAATIVLTHATATAQIVVSANVDRAPTPGRRGDTATVIDLNVSPPRVIVELRVPAAVQGHPQSVAIAPDESIALVDFSNKT